MRFLAPGADICVFAVGSVIGVGVGVLPRLFLFTGVPTFLSFLRVVRGCFVLIG